MCWMAHACCCSCLSCTAQRNRPRLPPSPEIHVGCIAAAPGTPALQLITANAGHDPQLRFNGSTLFLGFFEDGPDGRQAKVLRLKG